MAVSASAVINSFDSTPSAVNMTGKKRAAEAKKPFIMRLLLKSNQIAILFLRGVIKWKPSFKFYL